MIPAESTCHIAPGKSEIVVKVENIPACIEGDKKAIVVISLPVYLRIHVIEMHQVVLVGGFQDHVNIRSPGRDYEGTFLFYDGPFNRNPTGHGTNSACDIKFAVVAILRPDFEDGGKPASEARRNPAL